MTKIPVYSFTAFSGTGKTTFIEKLIPELKQRGLRVGALKHDAHNFDVDYEGKDTWKMTKAGADITAIASKTKAAVMINRSIEPEDMLELMDGVDIILAEGYSELGTKRILIYRAASMQPLRLSPDDCFALVTDTPIDTKTPVFGLEDAFGLANFIIADMKKSETVD